MLEKKDVPRETEVVRLKGKRLPTLPQSQAFSPQVASVVFFWEDVTSHAYSGN